MRPYVTIEIGEVPYWFFNRERDYYRCLAFTALVIARNQEWTGYKELTSANIQFDDMYNLGILSNPSPTGTFKILNPDKVTTRHIENPKTYHLDTSAFSKENVTDILIKRDSAYLLDDSEWKDYDVDIFNSLPDGAQDGFINKLQFDLNCPAAELLDNLKSKVLLKDMSYDEDMLNELSPDKQKGFLKKIKSKDVSSESAQAFLETLYAKKEEHWRAYNEKQQLVQEAVDKANSTPLNPVTPRKASMNSIPIKAMNDDVEYHYHSKKEACEAIGCTSYILSEIIENQIQVKGLYWSEDPDWSFN